jgi:hypothetical protein
MKGTKYQTMDTIGRRRWAIPEGYIPSESAFSDRALLSHKPRRAELALLSTVAYAEG